MIIHIKRKAVAGLLVFLFQFSYISAINSLRTFTNILPNGEAYNIHSFRQDSLGMIWFGTNKGLFCYDGYNCIQHYEPGETSNTNIHTIEIFDGKWMLLGTDTGLQIFDYQKDRYVPLNIKFPQDIRSIKIYKGLIWLGTATGVYTYNPDTRELKNKSRGLTNKIIYSLLITKDNSFYAGTYNGLFKYDFTLDKFQHIDLPHRGNSENTFINSLYEDSHSGTLWIGTEGALFCINPQNGQTNEILPLHGNSIKSLTQDAENNLVIGTDNGLYIYDKSTGSIQYSVHDSRNNNSLINNIIWDVFSDKDKNLWLGTDNGISLSPFNNFLKTIPIAAITGIGDGNRFYSIYKDSRGYYWLGGTNGLIRTKSVFSPTGDALWFKMGDPKNNISHNRIRYIYEDRKKDLWVASDGSICRFNYQNRQFSNYRITDKTNLLNSNWAYFLFEDTNGMLWIATCAGGVFTVSAKDLVATPFNNIAAYNYSTANGLSGNFVNQIVEDLNGQAWLLLYNRGINKIDMKTHKVERIEIKTPEGQTQNPSFIMRDDKGFIWAGLPGTIVRINPLTKQTNYIRFDSFNQNEVLSMCDVGQNIWVTTTGGVWQIHKKDFEAKRLNIPDKPYSCIFYSPQDNKVYLGGIDEISILNPEEISKPKPQNKIYITGLLVNDRRYNFNASSDEKNIRYRDQFTLNSEQNNLTFEFSDFNYSNSSAEKYVYRLKGISDSWNIIKPNSNRISFSGLNYGNYELIISKLDNSGNPSSDSTVISFRISPPWYLSIWAKIIYSLLIIGLIIWIINFFNVRHRLKIERVEKDKTLELVKMKIDFFTNVSHEFKTPLSMIVGPVSRLISETKDSSKKRELLHIQKNALKLNSLIRQLLDFNREESGVESKLLLDNIEIVEFAHHIFSSFESGFANKKLRFSFSSSVEKFYIVLDMLKMESVLNNLMSNACKFAKEEGKVEMSIQLLNEEMIRISVFDEGASLSEREIKHIFDRYYQSERTNILVEGSGIGLYLVKKYTEEHGGRVQAESETGKSTTVSIFLPISFEPVEKSLAAPPTIHDNKPDNIKSILIVEDEKEIAEFIAEIFSGEYIYSIAENGKEGLAMVETLNPDVVITDMMMPVMNGLEMVKEIRKNGKTSTIPILMLTAKDDRETELESMKLHIDGFISKPFDPEILVAKVKQIIGTHERMEKRVRVVSAIEPQPNEIQSADEKLLQEITHIIETHMSDSDLNVNALSEFAGVSSKQIYRKIKQLTGQSPVEFIRNYRLKKAAILLAQDKLSIAEVMFMVGFSNHSYFSKCFQKQFGKTPREFIDDSQNNTEN